MVPVETPTIEEKVEHFYQLLRRDGRQIDGGHVLGADVVERVRDLDCRHAAILTVELLEAKVIENDLPEINQDYADSALHVQFCNKSAVCQTGKPLVEIFRKNWLPYRLYFGQIVQAWKEKVGEAYFPQIYG